MTTDQAAPKEGIEVTQNAGFMCHIAMHSKLDVPHEIAFGVISDPDNARLFRNIDECTHRKVLYDNGRGRQRVEVDHKSGWRFLFHSGSFTTSLLVEQDDNAKIMAFRLRNPGFMRNFEGFWRMEPYPGQPQATLAVLHQNVLPCISAPGLNWVMTQICRAQIEAMLDDVKQEVSRIKNGEPIPAQQQQKMQGKRVWARPPIMGFAVDVSSDDDSPRAAAPSSQPVNGFTRVESQRVDAWELLEAAEHNMITPSTETEEDQLPAVAIS